MVKSSKSIFVSELAIITPTNISTGAVACVGIDVNIGAKNNASKNINPVVIAVNPVLPPSPIPAALSTYDVTVDVPSNAPTVVAIESESSACLTLGNFPSSSNILPFDATPTKHPTVVNKSINKNVSTTINISKLNI